MLPSALTLHCERYQDIGFDGIPELGTDDNVINKYFDDYFPRAVRSPTRVPHSGICVHSHPLHLSSVKPHRLNCVDGPHAPCHATALTDMTSTI